MDGQPGLWVDSLMDEEQRLALNQLIKLRISCIDEICKDCVIFFLNNKNIIYTTTLIMS